MPVENGVCVRVCSGRREAVMWMDPVTMSYRVLQCNWFRECLRRGILFGGHCPPYCDLVSGAKHYLRGRMRRNVEAFILNPEECEIVKYNPDELVEGELDKIDNLSEIDVKNFEYFEYNDTLKKF